MRRPHLTAWRAGRGVMTLRMIACAVSLSVVAIMLGSPADARPRARGGHHGRAAAPAAAATPSQMLAAANTAARQRPARDGFHAARHMFTYAPGAIYELHTSPNFISAVLLEPGETVIDIAAGDTVRWMVTQTTTETDHDGRTIILVKPQASGLKTNIVLITDRRTYLVEAVSRGGDVYAAEVAWLYPARTGADEARGGAPTPTLRADYRVRTVRGRRPAWTPVRVTDDSRRTWIDFPAGASVTDLPPLFVITGEGVELVNYRVLAGEMGPRYMIDRVFDVAELRLGIRAPTVVRIERRSPPRKISTTTGPRR